MKEVRMSLSVPQARAAAKLRAAMVKVFWGTEESAYGPDREGNGMSKVDQFNMAIDEDAKCARCGGTEALWLCPSPREHWSKEYLCEKCGEEIIGAKG